MRISIPLLTPMVVLFAATVAYGQTPWEVVTSKTGQFSVEMPTKPTIDRTRTRRGAGGTIKTMTIGCATESGVFLAYRIDLPTALVKGTEEAELDSARDDLAQEWNGKVIGEKKVKVGLRIGRDFTVRGKPAEELGVLSIRTRMYLDGRSIYAVMAVSAPNRELPEETGRFLGSLTIGNEKARVAGGLEPEPKGKVLDDWGLAIDTDNDCKFTPDGKKSLGLEIPGTWHDLNPHVNKLNAPRVVRNVLGDFSITVKVSGEFKPGGKPQNPKSVPSCGAGIIVWNNSDNFIRLERFAIVRNQKVSSFILFLEREAGYQGAEHNEGYPGGDCYLKMERKGSRITGLISLDGTKWKQLKPIDTLWPSRLKVGLSGTNSTSEPFKPRFEDYQLMGKVVAGASPGVRKED